MTAQFKGIVLNQLNGDIVGLGDLQAPPQKTLDDLGDRPVMKKFITMANPDNTNLLFAVGPWWVSGSYQHHSILHTCKQFGYTDGLIMSGGGAVRMIPLSSGGWMLIIGGHSAKYGVYNSLLEDFKDEISETLKNRFETVEFRDPFV